MGKGKQFIQCRLMENKIKIFLLVKHVPIKKEASAELAFACRVKF
jgi:hypothetical protein